MKTHGYEAHNLKSLAYRLRNGVTYHDIGGSPLLILDFPLKAIVFNRSWDLTFDLLSRGDFIPLKKNIASLVDPLDPGKVEIFLDDLVRKGFLERKGISTLLEYPFVSIIIPVRNRPEEIETCLWSLGQLDYPQHKMEIIVVDDASNDNTPDVASRFPVNLILLKEHKQASYCRNMAGQGAKGEILAFIDSDCLADPLWLRELVPAFKDRSLGAVGGMVDSYFDKKGLDRYEKVKSSLNMGSWFRRSGKDDNFLYVPSCNLLVRRDLFLRMDGFREEMHVGEDVDFCWRLQDGGNYLEYRPVGRVYHKHRKRLKSFCSRRFDYGTSEPMLQKSHAKRIKQMSFPKGASLFWGVVVLTAFFKYIPLLAFSGIILLIDTLNKSAKIFDRDIPIRFPRMFLAVFRGYLAFFYHCCAFVSRYYLIWAFLIIPLFPLVSAIILGMHFLTCLIEFFIKKPRLNLISFLLYFSLDQISYQSGVWWGCIKSFHFSPVNPQIVGESVLNKK